MEFIELVVPLKVQVKNFLKKSIIVNKATFSEVQQTPEVRATNDSLNDALKLS